ncbi:MCE family protein [Amycolatopsis sp. K13G38]|uniref:MCE family protein n=1 Tax=Amycolatopsis acididurans TaxID=2724524 RepID=A0ABX1J7H8_9PSEU|nr:MlaD family protein [Amycolatopsis acididurans]NKQ54247.1 MCE family protein [Amycolatopsis acididurans]
MKSRKAVWRTGVLGAFALACVGVFVYMFTGTGVRLPFTSAPTYAVSFATDNAGNLVTASDVQMAGVSVGKVGKIDNRGTGGAVVTVTLDPSAAPLHQGATVRVGQRSLVGEGYVDVVDGNGPQLAPGTTLPASAVRPSVQLDDVLRSLDPNTRAALTSLSRSLGDATAGSQQNISQLLSGLGNLGNQGYTAIDAVAAQSQDLTALSQEAATVLNALNSSEGQLGQLVRGAQRITSATSGQADSLRATMRDLPGVLGSAQQATLKLRDLSTSLGPVAADLKDAAPALTSALNELPATTADLRGMMPSLDDALARTPDTLSRLPAVTADARALVPTLRTTMSNLNPMLGYLQPYGQDLAAFFTNFGSIMSFTDEAGIAYLRLAPAMGNEQVPNGVPVRLPTVLSWKNPYPAPGAATNPGPGGQFTRIYPEQK